MSVNYSLINETKKERITFSKLPTSTKNEIVRNGVSARIVTFYLINNLGDIIRFAPDVYEDNEWPLDVTGAESCKFTEVTQKWVDIAESDGIISGRFKEELSDDEPELFYWRFNEE